MTQTEALDLDAAESRALSALAAWNGVEDVTHGEEERRDYAALRDLLPLVEELLRTNGDLAVAVAEATQARNDRDEQREQKRDAIRIGAEHIERIAAERDEARAAVEAVRALLAATRTLRGADPDTGDWEVSALALIDALGPVAETGEQR